jgi:hypothetical protein
MHRTPVKPMSDTPHVETHVLIFDDLLYRTSKTVDDAAFSTKSSSAIFTKTCFAKNPDKIRMCCPRMKK